MPAAVGDAVYGSISAIYDFLMTAQKPEFRYSRQGCFLELLDQVIPS